MLYWNEIDNIAKKLEENYDEEDIPTDNGSLDEMVRSLDEFDDHEVEVDDDHLRKLREAWEELRS